MTSEAALTASMTIVHSTHPWSLSASTPLIR
jgi:hypothetical protein